MLIDDLMASLQARRFIAEEEIEKDFLLALCQQEKNLATYRVVSLKRKNGRKEIDRLRLHDIVTGKVQPTRDELSKSPF